VVVLGAALLLLVCNMTGVLMLAAVDEATAAGKAICSRCWRFSEHFRMPVNPGP
jgi:hypothetical protein